MLSVFADGGGRLFTLLAALRFASSSGGIGSLLCSLLLGSHLEQPVGAGGIVKLVLVQVLDDGFAWISIFNKVFHNRFV